MSGSIVYLCPGQGSQAVGMGVAWGEASPAAQEVIGEADEVLGALDAAAGGRLSQVCASGPAEVINRTDISQPALFTVGIACQRALAQRGAPPTIRAAAGLSLGEYTALCIAGAFSFADGLRLVALRGRLMQQAAESSRGGMVALIGADEASAQALCDECGQGEPLVCANFNAPGQIVISGAAAACERAAAAAPSRGLRSAKLAVAGAFHSPLMAPAAEGMAAALRAVKLQPLKCEVWSNVTARPHDPTDPEQLRKLLVQQLTSPVRWSQSCAALLAGLSAEPERATLAELAPGAVLKGLMRRIDRSWETTNHDQPSDQIDSAPPA